MYIPKSNEVQDLPRMIDFIKEHSFGMLVSNNNGLIASHLPVLYDEHINCLIGHMAKANPQWSGVQGEVLLIFHGPHAYISPTWYEEEKTVPTWNYVAVHVYGEFSIVSDKNRVTEIINTTVETYENSFINPWIFKPEDEFNLKLLEMIVAFEIKINKWEGKWKLNQNHSLERQSRVMNGLNSQSDKNSSEIAHLMKQNIQQQRGNNKGT